MYALCFILCCRCNNYQPSLYLYKHEGMQVARDLRKRIMTGSSGGIELGMYYARALRLPRGDRLKDKPVQRNCWTRAVLNVMVRGGQGHGVVRVVVFHGHFHAHSSVLFAALSWLRYTICSGGRGFGLLGQRSIRSYTPSLLGARGHCRYRRHVGYDLMCSDIWAISRTRCRWRACVCN